MSPMSTTAKEFTLGAMDSYVSFKHPPGPVLKAWPRRHE